MTKATREKYKKLYLKRVVLVPAKHKGYLICKINGINEIGLFEMKDFNGNKYEFEKKEILFPTMEELRPELIKFFMKPGLVIDVESDDYEDFINYASIAGYSMFESDKNTYEHCIFLLNSDGKTVLRNAKTPDCITFSTIRNRVESKGAIGIEPFMVEELNEILNSKKSAIKVEIIRKSNFELIPLEINKVGKEEYFYNTCKLVLVNNNMVDCYTISPTEELLNIIVNYFKSKGVERLSFNNTRTYFSSTIGYHNL